MKAGEKSTVVIIKATNPESVVCPETILVNALTTLGVPLHPQAGMDYSEFREALPNGQVKRVLRWTLLGKSRDDKYKTSDLINWWYDPAWLKANPLHELTILRAGLFNMMRLANRVRRTPHINVYRRGTHQLHVPSHLPPEQQSAALARFEALDA